MPDARVLKPALDKCRNERDHLAAEVDRLRKQVESYYESHALLMDLDRCEHGRHEGDHCTLTGGCGGPSKGNPHIREGDTIGYTLSAKPIVMPPRDKRHLAEEWVKRD